MNWDEKTVNIYLFQNRNFLKNLKINGNFRKKYRTWNKISKFIYRTVLKNTGYTA